MSGHLEISKVSMGALIWIQVFLSVGIAGVLASEATEPGDRDMSHWLLVPSLLAGVLAAVVM